MLYEMIGIVRPGRLAEVKDIVLTTGQHILRNGGVIRDIANWGEFALPKTITKHQATHYNGHYFVMRYDAGVATQEHIGKTLRLDPRIIRVGTVKLGDQKLLGSLRRLGKVNWREGT